MKTKIALARVYAPITRGERAEDGYRLTAYAFVNEEVASGPPISRAAMESATAGYMAWANIREMHGSSAAGICERAEWTPSGCEMDILVVDPVAIEKCERGVYKGLSVGVRPLIVRGGRVEKCEWIETSLVDRPADPGAIFRLNRATDAPDEEEIDAEGEIDEVEGEIDEAEGELDILAFSGGGMAIGEADGALRQALAQVKSSVSSLKERLSAIEAALEEVKSGQCIPSSATPLEGGAADEEFVGRRAVLARVSPDRAFTAVARTFGGGAGQTASHIESPQSSALEEARRSAEAETDPLRRQAFVAEYSRLKQLAARGG